MKPLVFVLCSTPRCGSTVLLEALRGALPGIAEYPDASEVDGVYATMIHWTQMPAELPVGDHRYAYLHRLDRVAQAVSWVYAAASGRFHSTQALGAAGAFDRAEIDGAVAALAVQDRCWRKWLGDRPVLDLSYEENVRADPCAAARLVLDWLELPGEPAQPKLHPIDIDAKAAWRSAYAGAL